MARMVAPRTLFAWLRRVIDLPKRTLRLLIAIITGESTGTSMAMAACSYLEISSYSEPSWDALRNMAGAPTDRVFHHPSRLFGNTRPLLRLWRDREGWCPFCMMSVLLLEMMGIAYEVKKLPLNKYLREGETKPAAYLRMVPNGVVPGLQLSRALLESEDDADVSPTPEADWAPPLLDGYHIFDVLRNELPGQYPLGDARAHAAICEGGASSLAQRLQHAVFSVALHPSDLSHRAAFANVAHELSVWLEESGGPFVSGSVPSAADLQLLPWLERAEAYLPHVGRHADVCQPSWQRPRKLLEAAKRREPFADYLADTESLVSDFLERLGPTAAPQLAASTPNGAAPIETTAALAAPAAKPAMATVSAATEAAAMEASERQAAAAQLAAQPDKVGAFARRKARLRPAVNDSPAAAAMEDALKSLTSLLLTCPQDNAHDAGAMSARAAGRIYHSCGHQATTEAAHALTALACNVAVPRDLRWEAACAFRTHCRALAGALTDAGCADRCVAAPAIA